MKQTEETKKGANAEDLIKSAKEVESRLPEYIKTISARRVEAFLAIMVEIGVGDIINECIADKRGDDSVMTPVSAKNQVKIARKSKKTQPIKEKVKEVQIHIDYQKLLAACVEKQALSRMCAIVMDTTVEEVDMKEAIRYVPFLFSQCTALLANVTGLVANSV